MRAATATVTVTLALVGSLALAACNRGRTTRTESGSTIEESGRELSQNPFKAMQQMGEVGQKMAAKAKEMEKRKPVEPVKFDTLIPLLPEPKGWTAGEATGATTAMGEWKISNASRTYENGEGDARRRIKVEIVDGSYVPMVYAPFTMMTSFSHESTDGYTKGITIDGYPALEEWKKKSKDAKVVALVNDRFLVTIDGDNVEPEVVREWAGLVDLKKVAALE